MELASVLLIEEEYLLFVVCLTTRHLLGYPAAVEG